MKKITRVLCLILALVCATMMFTGCKEEVPEVAPRVAAIAGPTGVGMVNIMDKYEVTLASAADEVVGKVANGELDIAALPTNAAAALYNKLNTEVTVLCVNTLGVLYMMDNTGTVKTMAETALAIIGTNTMGITEVDWVGVLSAAALAGVVTILTCIKGLPEVKE